jgi:hypothetical protein
MALRYSKETEWAAFATVESINAPAMQPPAEPLPSV